MNATVNIICYKQKTLKNGHHPLMIRVSKNGKKKYKSLGLSVNPDHWDFDKNRPNLKCPNRELILKTILEKEAEFQREILELTSMQKEYTASSLLASKTNQINAKTVGEFYQELIKQFEKAGRIGNAKSYKASLSTLKRFKKFINFYPFSYSLPFVSDLHTSFSLQKPLPDNLLHAARILILRQPPMQHQE